MWNSIIIMSSENSCDNLEQTEASDEEEIMDIRMRDALNRCRTKIIKDLEIKHVIDALLEAKIVDSHFYDQIKLMVSKCTFLELFRNHPIYSKMPTLLYKMSNLLMKWPIY